MIANVNKVDCHLTARITHFAHANEKPFFSNLHFEFRGGDIVCLLGESGSGKTSFLRLLLGDASNKLEGEIEYFVEGSAHTPRVAKSQGFVGFFSEDSGLVPWLDLHENLFLPHRLNKKLAKPSERELTDLLDQVLLRSEDLSKFPRQLSFGMKQRARLVRTLLYSPRFLLLDETFTGLDPLTASEIAIVIAEYVQKTRSTCLLITHDLLMAKQLAKRILVLTNQHSFVEADPCLNPSEIVDLMKKGRC